MTNKGKDEQGEGRTSSGTNSFRDKHGEATKVVSWCQSLS